MYRRQMADTYLTLLSVKAMAKELGRQDYALSADICTNTKTTQPDKQRVSKQRWKKRKAGLKPTMLNIKDMT